MKVVLIASATSVHTQKWYEQLSGAGIEVVLITANPSKLESIEQIAIGDSRASRLTFFRNAGKVRWLIRKIRPDIVHACYASGYGWYGARSRFHPLVISVWGSDITTTPYESWHARRIICYNLSKADSICATSLYLAEKTMKLSPNVADKIEIVPFGVDTAKFKCLPERKFDNHDVIIGAAKNLGHGYGLDLLLKGFKAILDKLPEARIRIAGYGPAYDDLTNLARGLGIASRTEFLGHVKQADMPEFLNSIDILAVPSRNEAFGVASVEAMACGAPVVASSVGGNVEVLDSGKCGVLVEPESADKLADAIVKLVLDGEKRRKLSEAGRKNVTDNYEIRRCTEMQVDVYRRILSA
jgi:glycosyltransferase involved in cell wall biosynthesis